MLIIVLLVFITYTTSCFSQTYKIADEYFQKASALFKQGKNAEALEMYTESAKAEQKCEKPRLYKLANELIMAGHCSGTIGLYDKAITFYQKAQEIFKKLEKYGDIALTYISIGNVNKALSQYNKTIENYKLAMEIDLKLENTAKIAWLCKTLGKSIEFNKQEV